MILHALKEYYDRKADLPRLGFERKAIAYVIVLNPDGTPCNIECTYEGESRRRRAKEHLVPQAIKRTSKDAANLLWDTPEYTLGIAFNAPPARVEKMHALFKKRIEDLTSVSDEGLQAVVSFLNRTDKLSLLEHFTSAWEALKNDGANVSFKLRADNSLVCERQAVINAVAWLAAQQDGAKTVCMVTGELDRVQRLHQLIKGIVGAHTAGADIVSFNLNAFRSYGKKQGDNAPIGTTAAFAYTTALNNLLRRDSTQKLRIADSTVVFWAAKDHPLEHQLCDFFADPPKDDPDRNVRALEVLFRAPETGAPPVAADTTRFYLLGLAPNAKRLAIRLWIVSTVENMGNHIRQHFADLRITHGPKEPEYLSLFRLLASTAAQGKTDNIASNLAGDTLHAVFAGTSYPATLLAAAVLRCRAEHCVTYPRAALIKACLNRSTRFANRSIKEELSMSLDRSNTNVGYCLGRLFATLEKIQQESSPGINATIRDRYYGAASGTPATVFGTLMRLKNHHLTKLKHAGRRVFFEKLMAEIITNINDFPAHLALEDQGRFAIGYYHQMNDFFTKKAN